ncbi:hypothetical protein FBEOM_5562 [Fusarium beomiforme]|uniref:Myb-like domain-containing protein n=1 Tax=Fusarium beomiforme TaxID=44412 RepID=A0A9P5AL14_9HYPO|nr:hypothetical protein FBEOM_5562 [Fusarium beomiforme]
MDNSSRAIKPWQQKALARERTPLPEGPGFRPWLTSTQKASETGRQAAETSSSLPSLPLSTATNPPTAQAGMVNNQGYRFWTQDEVKRLIELKREGKSWKEICDHFPGRTVESIKQTYHKRRAAAEQQMDTAVEEEENQNEIND